MIEQYRGLRRCRLGESLLFKDERPAMRVQSRDDGLHIQAASGTFCRSLPNVGVFVTRSFLSWWLRSASRGTSCVLLLTSVKMGIADDQFSGA